MQGQRGRTSYAGTLLTSKKPRDSASRCAEEGSDPIQVDRVARGGGGVYSELYTSGEEEQERTRHSGGHHDGRGR